MAVLPIWFESPLGLQCCPSTQLAHTHFNIDINIDVQTSIY